MTIIDDLFEPLLGKPAWNVEKGVGTTLTFETMPGAFDNELGEMNDQWSLFEPSGKVFTLRRDGYYCYKSGRLIILERDWVSLF